MTPPGGERYPQGGYTGLGAFRGRRPPWQAFAAAIVLVAIGVAAVITVEVTKPRRGLDTGAEHAARTSGAPTMTAYPQDTCLYEVPGEAGGDVTLEQTPCAGDRAVLVVNHVVRRELDCARFGDYADHGLIQPDDAAGVVYCLALVAPRDACVRDPAPALVGCGTDDARRVVRIVRADRPRDVCRDLPGARAWYWRSPQRHLVACLVPA